MCDVIPYKDTEGGFFPYSLANENTQRGCSMTKTLIQLKGGKRSKKKTFCYTNGISYYVRKKSHKTRRGKTHLFRRVVQNKFSKKNCLTKKYKSSKSNKKVYGRP
jgi:hypothetical protein